MLSNHFQQEEGEQIQLLIQEDKQFILDAIEKSDKCISNDCSSYSENYVYKDLNVEIRRKNTIFKIEHRILFDPFQLKSDDKSAVQNIQNKYYSEKCYKNISVIYETIMNHIQFQIYKNQISEGQTEAFNSLNHLIEQKFPQLKDEENFYGTTRIKIYKFLIQQYRDECTKGLIYVMHSQPLIDFLQDQNNSFGSSSSAYKNQKQQFRFLTQPYYNIWNYNEILRSQAFLKCKKSIKYSFLSFNRRNYNIATSSGCQILSINSNFDERSDLKTFQFEGFQLLEVDQYQKEEKRVIEKIQQLARVRILLLCINNSQAIKDLIQQNILEGQQQHQRAIIYFPFKDTCDLFFKVLICQKFQLEFFKQYLNSNSKSIKESFDKAKEQTKNFILKKYDIKKEKNINFDKIFGDVPQIFSNPDSFIDQPFNLDENKLPQDITPLIQSSNILESINMDKTILKIRDIYQIKNFFNEPDVRFVNLFSLNNPKTGKTTLALSFAMTLLERNLHFTGGIHFIQNKHSNLTSSQLAKQQQQQQQNNISYNLSASATINDMISNTSFSMSASQSVSASINNFTNNNNHTNHQHISLRATLENLDERIFKNKGQNINTLSSKQKGIPLNQRHHHINDQPVLIILQGFDCFAPKQFEFIFERNDFPNYKFLNISNRRFALSSLKDYQRMFKNHEVISYKNVINRLIDNHKKEEEEETVHTQKKADNHHQSGKNMKNNNNSKSKQKTQNSKHQSNNNSHSNQGLQQSPISGFNFENSKNLSSSSISSQLCNIIPKTTIHLISQKSTNKQSSKSFSSDTTHSLGQSQSLNLNDIAINSINSYDGIVLRPGISEIQKDKDGFFDEIDKELLLKSETRQISNSMQLTPFAQQSNKNISSNFYNTSGIKENKQACDIIGSIPELKYQSIYLPADQSNFDEQDIIKNDIYTPQQNEDFSEISETTQDYSQKTSRKNRDLFGTSHNNLSSNKVEKKIRKPKYSSSNEMQDNKPYFSSQLENNQFEDNKETFLDDEEKEEVEQHHTDD